MPVPEPGNGLGGGGRVKGQTDMMMNNLHFYGHCRLVVDGAYNKTHGSAVLSEQRQATDVPEIRERSQGR